MVFVFDFVNLMEFDVYLECKCVKCLLIRWYWEIIKIVK